MIDKEKLELVKKLKEETGWGIMDCRRALNESNWEIHGAKAWLINFRKKSGVLFN